MKINASTPLKKTLVIAAFVFSALTVIFYGYTVYGLMERRNDDAVRIHVGGRLRMLSQKITKEVLLHRQGKSRRETIDQSREFFRSTLHSIRYGGPVLIHLGEKEGRSVPPVEGAPAQKAIDRVIDDWKLFDGQVSMYLHTDDRGSLEYILTSNEKLMMDIDSAVAEIQMHSEAMGTRLAVMFGVILAGIGVLLAGVLVKSIRAMNEASSRLAELEKLLPICSSCKKIRIENGDPENQDSWIAIEEYLHGKKDMVFTHGICPDCARKLYPGIFET